MVKIAAEPEDIMFTETAHDQTGEPGRIMAEAPTGSAPGPTAEESGREWPHVVFHHPFFTKLENVHFRLSGPENEPVMVVHFNENEVLLPFGGIKRELQLADDDPDAKMLDLLARSLKYVKGLQMGDPVPREVLTREASWTLSERHVTIAYQRIGLQLANWMAGGGDVVSDPEQLLQLAEDPKIKKLINEAFGQAAESLGLGRDHKEEVIHHVKTLAHELAYIEALRDRFRHILMMEDKVIQFRHLFGRERSVWEIADQLARLMAKAISDFRNQFEEIDAQTGEIIAVLKNLDNQIAYIRDRRDDLHIRLMAWDDILQEWDRVTVKLGPDKPDLLRRAYKFLAPRYMMVSEWVLMTKLGGPRVSVDGTPKNAMLW